MKIALLVLAFALPALFLSCEGPTGPIGPAGPPGASAKIESRLAQVGSDGGASVLFQNRQIEGSVVDCWLGDSPGGPWYGVATDIDYGLTCIASNNRNDLFVTLLGAPPNWWFLVTLAHRYER